MSLETLDAGHWGACRFHFFLENSALNVSGVVHAEKYVCSQLPVCCANAAFCRPNEFKKLVVDFITQT
jgi:hypothetical protein